MINTVALVNEITNENITAVVLCKGSSKTEEYIEHRYYASSCSHITGEIQWLHQVANSGDKTTCKKFDPDIRNPISLANLLKVLWDFCGMANASEMLNNRETKYAIQYYTRNKINNTIVY